MDLEEGSATARGVSSKKEAIGGDRGSRWRWVGVWGAYFLLALALMVESGAWHSDFGGHADEAAHVVTGLMVRDYLAGGFREHWHPVRYAEAYYERFPKVAIGHYPPGFYLVEALWLLPVRSGGALLAMMAALAATGGVYVWWLGGRLLAGRWAGPALGALFVAMPLVRTYTGIVMSDLLLVVLMGLAVVSFARFLESGRSRDSLAFGIWAVAAILTKAGGLVLALVPPLAIVLAGKWRLVTNWRLWLAPVPVALLGLPWMLMTSEVTLEGKSSLTGMEYLREAVRSYPTALFLELGGLMVLLLGIGTVGLAWQRWAKGGRVSEPLPAALWALTIALPVFFCLVPTGVDARYLLPLVPGGLVLAAATLEQVSARLLGATWWNWLAMGFALAVFADTFRPVEKSYTGASEAIRRAVAVGDSGLPETDDARPVSRILVSAGASGEGALTAAAALIAPDRTEILRAGKVLASSDWLGRGYALNFQDEAGLRQILKQRQVDAVIVEISPDGDKRPPVEHERRLQSWLESGGEGISPAEVIESERRRGKHGEFRLYRLNP